MNSQKYQTVYNESYRQSYRGSYEAITEKDEINNKIFKSFFTSLQGDLANKMKSSDLVFNYGLSYLYHE